MIRSMTGYGRGEADIQGMRWVVEVKSVNHRFLDVKSKLPPELFALDIEFNRVVQEKCARGRFEILVTREAAAAGSGGINRAALVHYLNQLRDLRLDLDIEGPITLGTLLSLPDVVQKEREPLDEDRQRALIALLGTALQGLNAMRAKEGEATRADMKPRIEAMRAVSEDIRARGPQLNQALRDRLSARLKELLGTTQVDASRLEQELAFLADRSDVTEELVRLGIHIKQFLAYLDDSEPVGRKMDFLLQEMNREVNTLGSKIADADVAQLVVNLKSELEKVREQVQNVE